MPDNRFGYILILMLLLTVPQAHARDYSLKQATAFVDVDPDGVVHVTETITYEFQGTYYEVFRVVNPPPGGSIGDIEIKCQPQPCQSRVDRVKGGYELVGVLPQPTPHEIKFIVSYIYLGGLKIYDDISELHYKMWGDEWEKTLGKIETTINLPPTASFYTQYWLHPPSLTLQDNIVGNQITVTTGEIPGNTWYEIRAVFPRIANPDPGKVNIQGGSGLEKILKIEAEYEEKQAKANNLPLFVWLTAIFAVAVPIYIYHRFGREPKIDYHAIYEREPPYKSKPAAVNAIMRGRIGKPDINAFVATVMDLVNRGFMVLRDVRTQKTYLGFFNKTTEDVVIDFKDKDRTELLDFEKDVFDFMMDHASENKIIWNEFKRELSKDDVFYKFINRWNKSIERHIRVERLFHSTGNYLLLTSGITTLILSIGGAIWITNTYPHNQFPRILSALVPGLIIFVVGLGSLILSILNEKGAGRFTPEGRLYHERWNRFKKYLTDFSALKEHPPESVKLWDFYLVYGVSLGVAEKVMKNMRLLIPDAESSNFIVFHHGTGYLSGFDRAYQSSNPTSSGGGFGAGGVGGGFGGGGGGAR
jgi:uncharacterized membrane protein